MENIYYSPEKWGLSVVAEIEYSDGNYVFDTRVVWRHKDGVVYTARDSGCSCPTPFENFHGLNHLEVLVNTDPLKAEIDRELRGYSPEISAESSARFLATVEGVFHPAVRRPSTDALDALNDAQEALR